MRKLRVLSLVLAILCVFATFVSCNNNKNTGKEYTYKSYSTSLGNNWNPHTWETNADDSILSYLSSPFVTMSIKDSENGVYQWVYEMATDVKDVTKDHQDDLTKYKVTLQKDKTAADTTSGYVYEIKLNPDAKWENGEKITADDYIYSMQQLLDSKMRNYRANLYWQGESAVAGGLAYYNSEAPIYEVVVPAYEDTPDYSYDVDAGIAKGHVYVNFTSDGMTLYNESIRALDSDYLGGAYATRIDAIVDAANAYGYTKVTAENKDEIYGILTGLLGDLFGVTDADEAKEVAKEALFKNEGKFGEKVEYDATVGCYKVDDYTIRYVNQTYIDFNYFLTSLTSTWLVYKPLYEAGKDTTGELVTTNYGTSKETTMSYGTYKLESLDKDRQIVFTQNENWYGFEKQADGSLISYTPFEVDGKKVQQYQTTKVVIDVMTDETAKEVFLKGELSEWAPSADDLVKYATSDRMYKVDETYTMSFFFDTNLEDLKKMDENGNKNSVVLSSEKFRKAFSLSIDRAEWVTATAGYKPAYAIMNNLYFYDVYNDPTSSYRGSDEAMQAICNLYGVEYGSGKAYATLKDAYQSITGYNLTEAKALMKEACDELVASGVYKKGEEITIRVGYKKGALDSSDNQQMTLMNKYINAAVEGSGFGKITLQAIDNVEDRYGDVGTRGTFAIGYGAWGGAAFYPFRNFQVYMDPGNTDLHEGRCWDPTTEKWTLKVNGQDVEMTCRDWSNCLIGKGQYAEADFKTKLSITAQLEEKFLAKYYRIPLAGSTACSLLSYQMNYYTEEYNIMYDFGGLRLMTYNYTDAEWADYVASQNGTLKYE